MSATTLPSHDLHNHTIYCGHAAADATVANLVARAHALGLAYFGISEHVIFPADAGRLLQIRADLSALPLHESPVQVLVGVEIDPDPLRLDGSWVVDPGPVDYAILSPHRLPEHGIGHWKFRELALSDGERIRLGEVWLDWYEACIENSNVTILGHPLREPMTLGLFSLRRDKTLSRVAAIIQRAAARGIVFELNNGWVDGLDHLGQFDPYVTLVREAKRCGMRFSRGSDSHGIIDIGTAAGIVRLAEAAGIETCDWIDPALFL